ncbi:MAG TPA: hypothetical protein VN631_08240 [Negativicutes bacterium]|nr:hypothetical protein [Negativicutes bacterium]
MDDQRKRLLVSVLFGVATIAATVLWTESYPTVPMSPTTVVSAVSPKAAITVQTPTMPRGAESVRLTVRDIFSPPVEYSTLLPVPSNDIAHSVRQTVLTGPAPVLTGVIAGEGARVAILRQGTISRSYRVGESAGAYQIASIGDRSVTLASPDGTTIVTMGP